MEFGKHVATLFFAAPSYSHPILTSFLEQLLKEEHEGEVSVVLVVVRLHPSETEEGCCLPTVLHCDSSSSKVTLRSNNCCGALPQPALHCLIPQSQCNNRARQQVLLLKSDFGFPRENLIVHFTPAVLGCQICV